MADDFVPTPGMYSDKETGDRYWVKDDGGVAKLADTGDWVPLPADKLADGYRWINANFQSGRFIAPEYVRSLDQRFTDDVRKMASQPEAAPGHWTMPEAPSTPPTFREAMTRGLPATGGRDVPTTSSQEWGNFGASPRPGDPALEAAKKAFEKKRPKDDESAFTGPVAENDRVRGEPT